MSAPNPFASDPARDFTDADWKQAVASVEVGGGDSFSGDGGGEATLVGTKVPFNKLQTFCRYWLGYQACVDSFGELRVILRRTLPKKHPLWQELAAINAHTVPFKPDAKPVAEPEALVGLKRRVDNYVNIPTVPFFSGYKRAKATIGFSDLDYDLFEDSGVPAWTKPEDTKYGTPGYSFPAEWVRFTAFDAAPKVETLSLDGFTMIYADGSGNASPTTNPKGLKTPAPVGQLLAKADLTLTTYKLPQSFLFGKDELLPRNILAAMGKVNRYQIFNRPPGTLLFTGCELSKRRFSLRASTETKYLWKMRCLFSFFDPPTGINDGQSYSTTLLKGHNNLFWIGAINTITGAPQPADRNSMKWFFATASGNPDDPGLLPTFDLAQLWRPVCNDDGTVTNPCYNTAANPVP